MAKKLTPAQIQARYNQDINYLKTRSVDVSNIKTPTYAHRIAQAFRDAEKAGKLAPTIEEARGHKGPGYIPITHFPKQGHLLEQYQIEASDTPTRELELQNLAYLVKRAPDPKTPWLLIVVSGIVDTLSPLDQEPIEEEGPGVRRTYTYRVDKKVLREWLKRKPAKDLTYDLWQKLNPQVKWLKIETIGIAYPKGSK